MRYEHRQIGYATIVALALGILVVLAVVAFAADDPAALWIAGLVALILACCLVLFSMLSVSVSDDEVRVWFGLGLIRKRFRANEIRAVHAVRNRWWYGWGIRLTPHGWMFNVSGLDAVEIERTDGKRFRIGTDEPKKLEAAIRKVAGAGD
ncbi:MAG TPA: hypothetical protein VMS76_14340 [Planctomycetota bacterium]|nr:hypothetical protein [Planctomycetota bacterium]